MTKTIFLFVIGATFSINAAIASELQLHVEKLKIGTKQVYIENIGKKEVLLLTKGLSYLTSGSKTEISPPRYVWIRNGKKLKLKDSLEKYAPVLLKPGEITFIDTPSIRGNSGTVIYKIDSGWAELHGTWSGVIQDDF